MMKYWRKVAIILVAILLVPLMPVSVGMSASALTESQLNMFSQNNIFFYDPSGGGTSCVGDNRDYNGGSVWGSDDLAAVEAHRQFYERAAEKYGFPWQIMAVIHYREHSLIRSNPDNGQGVYQLFSYTNGGRNENAFLPAGPISDSEFQRQSDIAAMVVAEKAAATGVDLKNMSDGDIQKVFYYYNGTAGGRYYERAIKMGLSEEDANNGGGSPYVMNKYDAMRDPDSGSVSPYWIGTYSDDNKYNATAVERRYGAYVLYAALTGGATCSYAGGSIAETALMLSWDGYRSHDKDDPKPEYVEAMKAVGAYQQGNGYYPYGASCDQFVGTVMRYSGADTEYPIFGPERQKNWMDDNPSMYEKIEANGDFTMLQPGDIFVTVNAGRHIYLYVGEIGGEMTQASASANDRTGEHYSGVDAVYFTDGGLQDYGYQTRYYEVYRRVDFKK